MAISHPLPSRTPTTDMLDLFAGPGGLDVAAQWLGIPVVGIEWDDGACATRRAAGLGTEQGDVRTWSPGDFGEVSFLVGGPPCQTYTVAGTGSGRRALVQVFRLARRMAEGEDVVEDVGALEDERTGLVLEPLRWALRALEEGRPYSAIVLEQVPAVLPVWRLFAEILESQGYHAATGVLHSEEFGVPQTRRRAVLIAHRDHQVELPSPTHRRYRKGVARNEGNPSLLPWKTMAEALPGRSPFAVVSNYGTGGDPKLRGRRRFDEPAATVTGKISRNRLVDPSDPGMEFERFSVAEAGMLQTFPSDYPWSGRDISQQIGNAIPPRLAAHVLASALGLELDPHQMDEVVTGKWTHTRLGAPLNRGRRAADVFEPGSAPASMPGTELLTT